MWFTGVVEDRIDPEYLGRVKVRCIGLHTDDKLQLLLRRFTVGTGRIACLIAISGLVFLRRQPC